ncbi:MULTISPECIES: hypothetical protein [Myxococcaceae]|uniref:hypothetical protein n=1 Tax=Myxococcaceae TaxID=31 RepID=UPI00188E1C3D|nr:MULTISPECIES: hypothetical protein [Myxococcaceae]MBF5046464.1 hypothetical protein [Simulacricoccus sp. 17bor-14]
MGRVLRWGRVGRVGCAMAAALVLGAGCDAADPAQVAPPDEQPAPAPQPAPQPEPVPPLPPPPPPEPPQPPPPPTYATQVPEDVKGAARVAGSEGWQFLTGAQGVPARVYGVSADAGGNIWVAGGSVISVLRKGASRFESFNAPQQAISISGGPAGVAFVGYMGASGCDMAWDVSGDLATAKTGDADRVWLTGGGLARAHYDISSGPGVVPAEPKGREKVCNIFRVLYDGPTKSVWFAGNHGVAWGDPESTFVVEHTHPAINCWMPHAPDESGRCSSGEYTTAGGQCYKMTLCSGDFNALAMDDHGDLWLGGRERSARFPWGTTRRFYDADNFIQKESNRVDVWPDAVPRDPFPQQQVKDDTFGLAPMPDGYVWAGSSTQGLALVDPKGKAVAWYKQALRNPTVLALHADPLDHSVWAGHGAGGLTRVQGTAWTHYDGKALGKLASSAVVDIQVLQEEGQPRRMLVAFRNGAIGIYSGD